MALSLCWIAYEGYSSEIFSQTRVSTQQANFDSLQTESDYFMQLYAADSVTFQTQFETEFLLLLDDAQMQQYLALSSWKVRKAYIEKYWQAYNPNPLTPQNDRLLNHLQRRMYARSQFPTPAPPYFDDRGKYWLKYGKPRFRYQDLGGERSLQGLVTIPFRYYSVIPNESWSYVNIAPNYVVHFVQKSDGYREIRSLKEVIKDSHRRGRMVWYWSDLLKRRFWMSSLVTNTVNDIEQLEIEAFVANAGRVGSVGTHLQDRMFTSLSQAEYEMQLAHLDVPAATYDPIEAKNKIPLHVDIVQFRGENGKTNVAVTMRAPLKKFFDPKHTIDGVIKAEFQILFSDLNFDSLAAAYSRNYFPRAVSSAENIATVVGYLQSELEPQWVELAYQIRNLDNDRIGFDQVQVQLRDFRDDHMTISDIQLFTEIMNPNQAQVLPVIRKQGLQLAPYPYEKIRKSQPMYCYFEVYNLKPQTPESEFEITYKVTWDDSRLTGFKKIASKLTGGDKTSISISTPRQFTEETAREIIELDLSNLIPGPYVLEIAVRGNQQNASPVTAKKPITIVD